MKYAFNVRTYDEAIKLTTPEERAELGDKVVAEAEKLNLKGNDYVIFDEHQKGLKVIVEWTARMVHIMTVADSKRVHLPQCGEQN